MSRLSFGFALVLAAAFLPAAPAAAQKNMKATAPEKMMPPGESQAMRACDKMAMDQHIAMEDRAGFVKDCIAKKMAKETK
jgi:hypothetical protein